MQPYVEADSEDLSICNQFPIELFIYMCIAGRLLQHFVCGIANVYLKNTEGSQPIDPKNPNRKELKKTRCIPSGLCNLHEIL